MSQFLEKHCNQQIHNSFLKLTQKVKKKLFLDIEQIHLAFIIANNAHKKRVKNYKTFCVMHLLEVAKILTDLNMDTSSIITALLHDTIENTILTYDDIRNNFGQKIVNMVLNVSKLTTIESKSDILDIRDHKIENYRHLMCAVAQDIRVLVIKLADRLHYMRTIHHIDSYQQRQKIARETMYIHATLAERIGIHSFQNELQDLAFAELYSDDKVNIEQQLRLLKKDGANLVQKIMQELKKILCNLNIKLIDITGREKRLCSIWKKIKNKQLSFRNVSDIFALRVIVGDINSCYQVLYVIHDHYHTVPGEFKDYISTPKKNGYKSLHTIIIDPKGNRIEIQIRTDKMHKIAEFGVAAHWQYKQNYTNRKNKKLSWINELFCIFQNTNNPIEVVEYSKIKMIYYQVFCFTIDGDLIALPKGATALDFAFYIGYAIGLKCMGAIVNKRTVPITYKLENGDQIEVICAKKNIASNLWLKIVNTARAKIELQKYLSNIRTLTKFEI